jgi:uncharacterized membrane protein (Fun14 family)
MRKPGRQQIRIASPVLARTRKKMIDNTIHPLITFTGSGVAGFLIGVFLRRVLKFLLIIIGSFLGAVFVVIQLKKDICANHNYETEENLIKTVT